MRRDGTPNDPSAEVKVDPEIGPQDRLLNRFNCHYYLADFNEVIVIVFNRL